MAILMSEIGQVAAGMGGQPLRWSCLDRHDVSYEDDSVVNRTSNQKISRISGKVELHGTDRDLYSSSRVQSKLVQVLHTHQTGSHACCCVRFSSC